jgi:hypothetical protein
MSRVYLMGLVVLAAACAHEPTRMPDPGQRVAVHFTLGDAV